MPVSEVPNQQDRAHNGVHDDGKTHARENVVHEIGLFQGRLGFRKSIIVKQNGTAEFSNIAGLTYIPYPKGKIEEAFPEIVRTLIREGVLDSRVGDRFLKERKMALTKHRRRGV